MLADLSTEMNDLPTTCKWAVIFLGTALKMKGRLATVKAFRCFGQIFAAEGDDQSALSLFSVALDGFTFMDVHRWRADCMVHIANILERQGQAMKSIALWKRARPLFEISSPRKDIAQIDAKLATVDGKILQEYETEELADVNAPLAVFGGALIEEVYVESPDKDEVPISILA
jgi:hypothetical protein